jgi:hypothetical protein
MVCGENCGGRHQYSENPFAEYWDRHACTIRDERRYLEQRIEDLENKLSTLRARLKEAGKPERPPA